MKRWVVAVLGVMAASCSAGVDISAPVSDTTNEGDAASTAANTDVLESRDSATDAADPSSTGSDEEPPVPNESDGAESDATLSEFVQQEEDPFLRDREGSDPSTESAETDAPTANDPAPSDATDPAPRNSGTDDEQPAPVETDAAEIDPAETDPSETDTDGSDEPVPSPEMDRTVPCDGCVEDNEIVAQLAALLPGTTSCDDYPVADTARFWITPELRAERNVLYIHLHELVSTANPLLHETTNVAEVQPAEWMTVEFSHTGRLSVTIDASARAPALGVASAQIIRLEDGCPIARVPLEVHLAE